MTALIEIILFFIIYNICSLTIYIISKVYNNMKMAILSPEEVISVANAVA
jgi:hypothetical protein